MGVQITCHCMTDLIVRRPCPDCKDSGVIVFNRNGVVVHNLRTDAEINIVACLTEIMAACEMKS